MAGDLLVTGGTGTVGSRTVAALRTVGIAPRIAARTPHGDDQVRFDYGDASTFQAAFEGIGAVFLVAPSGVADMLTAMRPFLEAAVSGGVERFVLLSAAAIPEGGPLMGAVHAYLHERAPSYAALQPSWFMQNFTGGIPYPTIATENAVISATGDGRVAFVDAVDIAAVAARALRDRELTGGLVITGPRAISYDEAAEEISRAAGRRITHRKLTPGELATTLGSAEGCRSRTLAGSQRWTSRSPVALRIGRAMSSKESRVARRGRSRTSRRTTPLLGKPDRAEMASPRGRIRLRGLVAQR